MKTIGYRTAQTARRKFNDFFAGRDGVRFFEVTQEDFDDDDNWAPGGYIEAPDAMIDAWDAGLREIKLKGRLLDNSQKTALVKELMDKAS